MLGFSHGSLSNLKVIWQGSKWRSTSLVRGSRRSICRSYQSSSAQKPDGGTKRRLCFLDSKNLPSRFPKSWKVSGKNRVGWDGGKHPMLRRSFNDLRYDALRCCAYSSSFFPERLSPWFGTWQDAGSPSKKSAATKKQAKSEERNEKRKLVNK